jgi:hypothetical protein
LLIGDVARELERSTARVAQLDDELEPLRGPNGWRRYDPKIVAKYIAKRNGR